MNDKKRGPFGLSYTDKNPYPGYISMKYKPQKKYYVRKEAIENEDITPYCIVEEAYLELDEESQKEYIPLVQLNG
jgi:hypothetical protein